MLSISLDKSHFELKFRAMKFLGFLFLAIIAIAITQAKPAPDDVVDTSHTDGEGTVVSDQVDAEEGEHFQGDILLTEDQKKYFLSDGEEEEETDNDLVLESNRTGLKDPRYRWPKDAKGNVIVPYTIDPNAKFATRQTDMLKAAMAAIEKVTCIKFVPRVAQADYIQVINGQGCYSNIGRIGGKQVVSLAASGCFPKVGKAIHELTHALGYDHMQNHVDRDTVMKIRFENIADNQRNNFAKVDPRKTSNFNTNFDFDSVMMYPTSAFSKNGQETMIPNDSNNRAKMGQRDGLSRGDVARLRNMYQCANFANDEGEEEVEEE